MLNIDCLMEFMICIPNLVFITLFLIKLMFIRLIIYFSYLVTFLLLYYFIQYFLDSFSFGTVNM